MLSASNYMETDWVLFDQQIQAWGNAISQETASEDITSGGNGFRSIGAATRARDCWRRRAGAELGAVRCGDNHSEIDGVLACNVWNISVWWVLFYLLGDEQYPIRGWASAALNYPPMKLSSIESVTASQTDSCSLDGLVEKQFLTNYISKKLSFSTFASDFFLHVGFKLWYKTLYILEDLLVGPICALPTQPLF